MTANRADHAMSKHDRPLQDLAPLPDLSRQADPTRTTIRAAVILFLFAIAVCSTCYIGWMLYHLPAVKP